MRLLKQLSLFILIFAVGGNLLSCKKEVSFAEVGTTEVSFVFLSPTAGEIVNGSQEVSIEARIDANAMMSGYRITISNNETGEIMERLDDLYEQTQYTVHHHWYPNPSEVVSVKIVLEALDKNMQALGSDSIQITCNP